MVAKLNAVILERSFYGPLKSEGRVDFKTTGVEVPVAAWRNIADDSSLYRNCFKTGNIQGLYCVSEKCTFNRAWKRAIKINLKGFYRSILLKDYIFKYIFFLYMCVYIYLFFLYYFFFHLVVVGFVLCPFPFFFFPSKKTKIV